MAQVTVEFYGIPRQRAGRAEVVVSAGTLAEVLAEVERACPSLGSVTQSNGRMASSYLLSVGGQQFVSDLTQPVRTGERLLLLSADAGG